MDAGSLRHRVTVQTRSQVSDGHDGFTESWVAVSPARKAATVEPLSGRALDQARQLDLRAGHLVTLRYWSGYLAVKVGRARIVWHDGTVDRYLEPIERPREVEDRETLAVICRETDVPKN